VGANCSITSRDMRALADEALAALAAEGLSTPLVLQPNAGQPRLEGSALVYDQAPAEFAAEMAAMARAGATLVGGCCGTDPRFVAALRAELHRDPR
jgi:5-methyltetrahydrofolate--homocysteine methyltransferase